MTNTFTVHLPNEIRQEIELVAESEGRTPDEIVCQSVQDYLFLRDFRSLRRKLVPTAAEQGIRFDQDVFDQVS